MFSAQGYLFSLKQTKQNIFHSMKELNEVIKNNQSRQIKQTLNSVLTTIATFDEGLIKQQKFYQSNKQIREVVDNIIDKIKNFKSIQIQQKIQVKVQAEKMKTSSERVQSKSVSKVTIETTQKRSNTLQKKTTGILGGMMNKILGKKDDKAYKMILQQSEPKKHYDPVKKKWIFQGEEQQPQKQIPKPPPKLSIIKSQSISNVPNQLKKNKSQLDELTAPPSFKRKGLGAGKGATKKLAIKQQQAPITLVQQENTSFNSIINMIDKQFYKLEQKIIQIETKWKRQYEHQVTQNLNNLKRTQTHHQTKDHQYTLTKDEVQKLQNLNNQLLQANQISNNLMQKYISDVKNRSLRNNKFQIELGQKLLSMNSQNTSILNTLIRNYPNRIQQHNKKNEDSINNRLSQQKFKSAESKHANLQISNLQNELNVSKNELRSLKAQLKLQNEKMNTLKASNSLESNQDNNQSVNKSNSAQKNDLFQQLSVYNKRIVQLSEQLKQRDDIINQKEEIIQNLRKSQQQSKKQIQQQLYSSSQKISQLIQISQQRSKKFQRGKSQLVQQNNQLKTELSKIINQRQSLEMNFRNLRNHSIADHDVLNAHLQLLSNFAQQLNQQSNLLEYIQNKRISINATYSDRSSQNSSKKSSNENRNDSIDPNIDSSQVSINNNSILINLSQITSEITRSYLEKFNELKQQNIEFDQKYKLIERSFTKQISHLKQQNMTLQKSINTIQSLNQVYKKGKRQNEQKISSYQTQIQKLNKKIKHYKQQQLSNKSLIEQTLIKSQVNYEQLHLIKLQKQRFQIQIEDLIIQLNNKNSEIQQKQQQCQSISLQLNQNLDKISKKQLNIKNLKNQLQQAQQQLKQLTIRKEQQLMKVKSKLRQQENRNIFLNNKLNSLNENHLKHQKQLLTLNQNLSSSHSHIRQLEQLLKHKQTQINDLFETSCTNSQQIQKLSSHIEILTTNQKYNKQNCQNLQQTINHLNHELDEKNHLLNEKDRQIGRKDHQSNEKNDKFIKLQRQSQEQIQLIQCLSSQKDNLQYKYQNLKESLNSQTKKTSLLQGQIQKLHIQKDKIIEQYQYTSTSNSSQSLNSILKQKQQLQNHLQKAIQMYKFYKSDSQQIKINLQQKISYLVSQLQKSFEEGQILNQQKTQFTNLINVMDRKINQLSTKNLKNNSQTNQQQICKDNQQIHQLLLNLQSKQAQNIQLITQFNELNENYKIAYYNLLEEKQINSNKFSQYEQQIERISKQNMQYQIGIAQLSHKQINSQVVQQLIKLKNQHTNQQNQTEQLLLLVQNLSKQTQKYKQQIQKLKYQKQQQKCQSEQHNQVLKYQNQVLKQQNQALKPQNQSLKQQNQSLKYQNQALNKNIEVLLLKSQQNDRLKSDELQQVLNIYQQQSIQLQIAKNKLVQFQKTIEINQALQQQNYQVKQQKSNILRNEVGQQNIQSNKKIQQQNEKQEQYKYEVITELSLKLQAAQNKTQQVKIQLAMIQDISKQLRKQLYSKQQIIAQHTQMINFLKQTVENTKQSLQQKVNQIIDKDTIIQGMIQQLNKNQQSVKQINKNERNIQTNQKQLQLLIQSLNQQIEQRKTHQVLLIQKITLLSKTQSKQQQDLNQKNVFQTQNVQFNQQKHKPSQQVELYEVIQQMQKQIENKNSQISQLNRFVDKLNQQLQNSKIYIQNQEVNQNQKYINQISILIKAKQNLQQQVQYLTLQIKEKCESIQNEKMYSQILKDQNEKLLNKQKLLTQIIGTLRCQIVKLKSINNQQALTSKLQKSINQQQKQINQQQKSISKIQQNQELQQMKMLVRQMEEDVNIKQDKITSLTKANNQLQSQIQSILNDIATQKLQPSKINNTQKTKLKQHSINQQRQYQISQQRQYQISQQKIENQNKQFVKEIEEFGQKNIALNLQISQLRQQISNLDLQINIQKQINNQKQEQIQDLTSIANTQNQEIQKLQTNITNLRSKSGNLQSKMKQTQSKSSNLDKIIQLQSKIKLLEHQLQKVKASPSIKSQHPAVIDVNKNIGMNKIIQTSTSSQKIISLKSQLQQTYGELRNRKIEIDQLRKNIAQVNVMYQQRQLKFQNKIRTLQRDLAQTLNSRNRILQLQSNIKQLQAQINQAIGEKAQLLRVNDRLQKQIIGLQKKFGLGSPLKPNHGAVALKAPQTDKNKKKQVDTNIKKNEVQVVQKPKQQNLRVTKSQRISSVDDLKPTGFFGSISSFFMTPIQTQRMLKTIEKK